MSNVWMKVGPPIASTVKAIDQRKYRLPAANCDAISNSVSNVRGANDAEIQATAYAANSSTASRPQQAVPRIRGVPVDAFWTRWHPCKATTSRAS